MELLKIQCKSAGSVWPDILYAVQSDIVKILTYLQEKTALTDDKCSVERKCGGKEITMTLLPDKRYVFYLGVSSSDLTERYIVEYRNRMYSVHKQLFLLLDKIVVSKG